MTAPAISPDIVGTEAGPLTQAIDARWLMAYAAAARAHARRFFDTLHAGGPPAHPLFPVCYEWPLLVDLRERALGAAVAPYGVHATHHVVIHRPPRAGDTLVVSARVTEVVPRRAGAFVMVRLVARDGSGALVTTTDHGSVYRGVAVSGTAPPATPPAPGRPASGTGPAAEPRWTATVDVPYHDAHVYTEGARIWNPIHTDVASARAAGLAGPILHGTATLAYAVSLLVARELGGEAEAVREVTGRFTGMVPLGSSFTVRALAGGEGALAFEAVGPAGALVLSGGLLRT